MNVSAVSSLNLDPSNESYIALEKVAFDSWKDTFDQILYLNTKDARFDSEKTQWIESDDPPRILDLALEASQQEGASVLINADVWVRENCGKSIVELVRSGYCCGMTNRFNYNPEQMNIGEAMFHPGGFDMFYGTQEVWQDVASRIPDVFRIGITIWDAWMMNYLQGRFGKGCVNFTHRKLMAHPLTHHWRQPSNSTNNARKNELSKAVGEWYSKNQTTDPVMTWKPGKQL